MITGTGHPLCVDNFGDYMTWDRVIYLASGLTDDVDVDSPLVDAVIDYVDRQDGDYSITRDDAAELLNTARDMR